MRPTALRRVHPLALAALVAAGCADPLVAATRADALPEAADDDLPKYPIAAPPPPRRDVPRAEVAEPDAADDDAPDVVEDAPPDVVDDAADARDDTPPDVADAALDADANDAGDAAPDAGLPLSCDRDASSPDAAEATVALGPDAAPTACTDDGQVSWYSRAEAPAALCVMCVCHGRSYACVERTPDRAPLVAPTVVTGAAPEVPLTWRMIGDGVYELTALRWLGGCPRGTPRPLREVVEVRHGYASHTFLAFARRVDGGALERSLYFAREYEGGAFFINQWCPASGPSLAGVLLRLEGAYPDEGFTLYQPENADGSGPVLARTYRRVE